MALPQVTVTATPGEPPTVTVDGQPVPGVLSVQVSAVAGQVPHVSLVLPAGPLQLDLDGRVNVVRTGPTASEFADRLDIRRLEHDALNSLDDCTQGEAFAAAVRAQAAEFDDHP